MFYIIVAVLGFIMVVTKGFSGSVVVYSYNDFDRGIIDGFIGYIVLSIPNCIIIALMIIATIVVTFNKKNAVNKRILLLILIVALMFCVPIGIHSYSGGIEGITKTDTLNLWNIPFCFFR